jgi:hypothetical protein
MTEITLQAVRAKQIELSTEQTKLAAMVAALMNQTCTTVSVEAFDVGLRDGEHYAGAVLDEDGELMHHLVLMAEKPVGRVTWQAAMDWAASVNGVLPTRQEQALLFANCKPHLDADWHWSSQTHETNASYAWYCYFNYGNQGLNAKSYAGCARAVRRLNP